MNDATKDTVTVHAIPDCDVCKFDDKIKTPAAFDGKTTMGPWAFMCPAHFTKVGVGLGLGKGQTGPAPAVRG